MLGNDIVDLADPEACESTLHPRFDARVFAAPERVLLAAAADRGALRWALWAAKEREYRLRSTEVIGWPLSFLYVSERGAALSTTNSVVGRSAIDFLHCARPFMG